MNSTDITTTVNRFRNASPAGWTTLFVCTHYTVLMPIEVKDGFASVAWNKGGQAVRREVLEALTEAGILR